MNIKNIKGDISGGIIAGVIALPLALAFGIASKLGAPAGLWGAIVLGFFAAAFGGTKMQVSGPTGPMTVISAAIVVDLAGDIGSIMAVFVMTGIFQILFGLARLGKLVKYIPYSVISGFMSGVGFIIIILQINPMLGADSVSDTLGAIAAVPHAFANLSVPSVCLAAATLAILYLTPKKISAVVPAPLLAILALTPVVYFGQLNVGIIGDIPTGLPDFVFPFSEKVWEHFPSIIMYAVMLALLGSIDSLLTSLVADSITKTKHRSNQELVGQGIGNALVGFVGGIPGAGATMRTVANIKAGGMGRLSGMTHSIFLLSVVLILAPLVKYVPLAVLSGILLKVGLDILDYRLLKRLSHIPRKDLIVMLIVFGLTVFVNLILAVFFGVFLAWFLYETGVSKPNRKFNINVINEEKVKIVKINGPMYFGTNAKIMDNLNPENGKNLTIDMTHATFMDISSVYSLQDFVDSVDSTQTKVNILIDDESFSGNALNEFKYILRDNISRIHNS